MDTSALTNAWLDAVYRTRSAAYQNYVDQVPQTKPSRADRTLADTIESALKDGGARPLETINPIEPPAATAAPAAGRVDILA